MSVSYTCPNPDCGVTLKTPKPVAAGKTVNCPKCKKPFEPAATVAAPAAAPAGGGTLKFADDGPKKPADAPKPPPPPKPHPDDDDEDQEAIKKGYGVVKETEAELKQAAKNKPKFTEVADKFKKSARGPAIAQLVMPANLLTASGLITGVAGLALALIGMWPLVFNDAAPGDEETEDAIVTMLLGLMSFLWGGMVCFGASKMQELGSYTWAVVGSVMGVLPLLVGIFALITLMSPKVKAGFEETEGGPEEDEEKEKKDGDEDEDDDGDEDEDDEDDE